MKKTIMPTKSEHLMHVYLMGIGRILGITAALTAILFLILSLALNFTGFREEALSVTVVVVSAVSLISGNLLGSFLHLGSLKKSAYHINEKRIHLYIICNCLYATILYFMVLAIL